MSVTEAPHTDSGLNAYLAACPRAAFASAGGSGVSGIPLDYPRGRYGGTLRLTLRLPVPAHARSDGVRVFEHYNAIAPQRTGV